MYKKFKDTIRAAGHPISTGGAITPADFQSIRDYAYLEGKNAKQLIADAHAQAKAQAKAPVKAAPAVKAPVLPVQVPKAVVAPVKAPEPKGAAPIVEVKAPEVPTVKEQA